MGWKLRGERQRVSIWDLRYLQQDSRAAVALHAGRVPLTVGLLQRELLVVRRERVRHWI